jgi:hypothetical protein
MQFKNDRLAQEKATGKWQDCEEFDHINEADWWCG